MSKEEDYYIEFDKLKVGDKVWNIQHGYIEVTGIKSGEYPIITGTSPNTNSYTKEGKSLSNNKRPNIYKKSPFEQEASEFPRIVMVKEIGNNTWIPRVALMIKNGKAIAWNGADTFEKAKKTNATASWEHWKEIEPEPVIVERTIKQLAELLGIKPEQLRIKDK